MADIGDVDAGVRRFEQSPRSSFGVEHPVALELLGGLDEDEEAEAEQGQRGERHQEREHEGAGEPRLQTLGPADSVNLKLEHFSNI